MLETPFGKAFSEKHFYTTIHRKARMKTKKIDKEFLITDSSVNCYGFRLLTQGYLKSEFEKNPIGYYMHDREEGVVVRWEDLRIDGDSVFGKPVINLSNERGQQTVDEIENSFLNGASVGHIVAMEWSEDPLLMLPGQTGPTITKWYHRECSLVDVPGNMNALALYDIEGNILNLADFKTKISLQMKQVILTAAQLSKLNLKAEPEAAEVETTINDLVAKAAKVDDLQAKLDTATTAKTDAETKLADLQKKTTEKEVADLIAAAKTEKKITVEAGNALAADYKENPAGLKALLATMQPIVPIVKNLKEGDTELEKMSWADLDKAGKLEDLKAKDETAFYDKYKTQFNKKHKDDKRAD